MTNANATTYEATKAGVEAAFWDWMTSFDVTHADLVRTGVRWAVETWLDTNGEAILAAVARDAITGWLDNLDPADLTNNQKENEQ